MPQELVRIITKALEKDRNLRYQHASDLRGDLQRLQRDTDSGRLATVGHIEQTGRAEQIGRLSSLEKKAAAGSQPVASEQSHKLSWQILIPGTAFFVALIVGALYWRSLKSAKLSEADTIVLADFTNTTGDPVFDGALRQGLAVQLEQSPFLRLVADEQIHQSLQMMGQPADAKLTPTIARELCQRTASAAVLEGSIAQIGSQYLLTLKAVNCASSQSLASTEARASDKNNVLDALGKVTSEIRNKLGESLTTVKKFDICLPEKPRSLWFLAI